MLRDFPKHILRVYRAGSASGSSGRGHALQLVLWEPLSMLTSQRRVRGSHCETKRNARIKHDRTAFR